MKRIFLTSGLVLCMACPAFATGFTNSQSGTVNDGCDYGDLETFTGPVQLQAIWNAEDYTLEYIANAPITTATGQTNTVNGLPATNPVTITYDASHTVATPSLTGYTFNGWTASTNIGTATGPSNSGLTYYGGSTIANYKGTGAQTMTANWTANQYDVIYNTTTHSSAHTASYTHTNGATYDANYALPQSSDSIYGDVAAISAPATGYSFVGWTTDSSPVVTRGTANGTTPVNTGTVADAWTGETPWRRTDNLSVYAAYIANQYNITYSCTGGEPSGNTGNADGVVGVATGTAPATQLVTFDSSYTLAANTCTLQGYVFNGWDCPNLVGTAQNTDGYFTEGAQGNYAYAGSVICTAKWKADIITDIQWDAAGGSYTGTPSTSCTYDGSITLPTNPQKTGYEFGGWQVVGHNPSPSGN